MYYVSYLCNVSNLTCTPVKPCAHVRRAQGQTAALPVPASCLYLP